MDDLLKVFFWETSECIAACWLAVDRLREVPDDADSFEDMLDQIRTMRETSRFLGMSALQVAASAVLDSLEAARASKAGGMDRIMPLAVDGLRRIEAVVKGMMIADAAMAEESPTMRAPAAAGADMLRSKTGKRKASGLRAPQRAESPRKNAATPIPDAADDDEEQEEQAAAAPRATAAAPMVEDKPAIPVAAKETAGDGTVRIDAQTLNFLVSTVRSLADNQAELMRLLTEKEAAKPMPAEAPATAMTVPPAPIAPSAQPPEPVAAPPPEPVAAEPVAPCRADSPGMRCLVFRAADGLRKAVRLDRVESLEQVELKAIDNARGLWVTRWSGNILPLMPFDSNFELPAEGRAPIIVFRIGGQYFGMLVGNLPVTADAASGAGADGVVIDGDGVELIDPAAFFERFVRGRPDRRRRSAAKSLKLQETLRPAIPDDDNLFVRKSVR